MHVFTIYILLSIFSGFLSLFYLLIGFLSKPKNNFDKKSMYSIKDLTIIVPVYKEPTSRIKKILNRYKEKVKLIFSIDERDPNLRQIVKILKDENVSYVISKKGKKTAIKTALSKISTPLVGLLDADSMVSLKSLNKLISKIDDSVGGIAPRVKVYKVKKPAFYYFKFFVLLSDFSNRFAPQDKAPILFGNFSIYKSNLLRKFFKKRIKYEIGDDKEIPDFILSLKKKVIIDYGSEVYTYPPKNWKKFYRILVRWNRAGYIFAIKRLFNGLAFYRGYRYTFNAIFIVMFPILSIILTILGAYINFNSIIMHGLILAHSLNLRIVTFQMFGRAELRLSKVIIHITGIRFDQARFISKLVILLTRISSILYIVLLLNITLAIKEIKRIKEFLYALIALPILSAATLYSLFTLYNVNSWESK